MLGTMRKQVQDSTVGTARELPQEQRRERSAIHGTLETSASMRVGRASVPSMARSALARPCASQLAPYQLPQGVHNPAERSEGSRC